MKAQPFRTAATELTLDQLMIADFLAIRGPAPQKFLGQQPYAFHMNLAYTHGIPDEQLEAEVQGLVRNEWVVLRPVDETGYRRYALTPTGGALWEAERTPIWPRYCSAWYGDEGGKHDVEVFVYDIRVGEEFLRVADQLQYELRLLPGIEPQWEKDSDGHIRYWDEADSPWRCQFEIGRENDASWNRWDELNKMRTWWDTLDELQKFLPQ